MSKKFKFTFLMLAILFISFVSAQAAEPTFSDLNETDEHFLEIEYLVSRDVIDGYEDGTFQSYEQITRAELVKLMVAMQGIEPDPEVYQGCFTDIDDGWEAPYVCYAKEMEWIHGYPDGYFRSDRFVNWSETLKIVLNPLFKDEIAQLTAENIANYADKSPFAEDYWSAPFATYALMTNVKHGWGMDEVYTTTRGDVADFISNSLVFHENDLEVYHDYFRDVFLKEQGYGNLIPNDANCYRLDSLDFDFYSDYLSSEHSIDFFDRPLKDKVYFCNFKNGDFLFSGAIKDDDQGGRYLIRFDSSGNLITDQWVECSSERPGPIALSSYNNSTLLLPRDPQSLELIDCSFFKDEYGVYYHHSRPNQIKEADPETFVSLGYPYAMDANHVYHLDYNYTILEDVDFEAVEVMTSENFNGGFEYDFLKDANQLFIEDELFEGVDLETFETLFNGYSKDKNHVYYGADIVIGADPSTFEVVEKYPEHVGCCIFRNDGFDQNYFFRDGEIAPWFDPDTTTLFGPFFVRNDGDLVHFNAGTHFKALGSVNDILDADDFERFELIEDAPILKNLWAKTNDKVFLMSVHLIEVTDANSFEFIDAVYSKDQFNVFHLEASPEPGVLWRFLDIPGADSATFESLTPEDHDFNLGKDDQAIYQNLTTLDTGDLDIETAYFDEIEEVLRDGNGYECRTDIDGLFESCLE